MMVRTGKALAQEQAWRAQHAERVAARAIPAPVPLRDNRGFWIAVCVLMAFVAALILH